MSEFTKGKWNLSESNCQTLISAETTTGIIPIAMLTSLNSSELQANARLIAAAPEMYELLKKILDDTQDGHFADENAIIEVLNSIDEENRQTTIWWI